LGLLIVGVGGAVATTVVGGLERLKRQEVDYTGLPLANVVDVGLVDYEKIEVAGWDLNPDNLATALAKHRVLSNEDAANINSSLSQISPWPAVGNAAFSPNVSGPNNLKTNSYVATVERLRQDIRDYRDRTGIQRLVMINLASVEGAPADMGALASVESFRQAVCDDAPSISPAMLYAYAAILEGVPYGNFTPSLGADIPALASLADARGVPIAGRDGKTGQTFLKTVIAPAFRDRNLHVDGWFSTNILGNGDGRALVATESLKSKILTKAAVIDDILGYKVQDHIVHIHYYRPRGDNKEAWDNIDLVGFLGQPMQLKIDFLCKDSILAAPLVIEIARGLDLAQRRGESGAQSQFSAFFKAPLVKPGERVEHEFSRQQFMLLNWLKSGSR
jgi:myo-inositol-1-phosphate synthase